MDSDFTDHVTDAVREMADPGDLSTTVERAVRMCVDAIRHCDMAGVSLVEKSGIRTLAASTESLRDVDELQYRLREGPCYDALRHEETVTANDLALDARWPVWGSQLAEQTGLHASMSFRLFTTKDAFGVLNLYSAQPNGFDAADVREGSVLAAMVAVALAGSLKEAQLEQGLETRTVIGQATGILMERFGMDAVSAFAAMRRLSQTHNVKLSALAEELVENGSLPIGYDGQSRHRPATEGHD